MLVVQMSQDLFVPISVVAQFKMVKQLCDDHDTIVRVLKSSSAVQVRRGSLTVTAYELGGHCMCSNGYQ